MDQRFIANFLTFMSMHSAEVFMTLLFGISFSSSPVSGNIFTARLDNSLDKEIRKGFVELTSDGVTWYRLCDNGRSSHPYFKVASMVCQQLGHGPPILAEGHTKADYNPKYLLYNDGWCNITSHDVFQECTLEESFNTVPDSCYGRIMYVECLPSEANEYDVELVVEDSFGRFEGLVLVYVNGHWGPVCSGSGGDTVCHQLGHGSAYSGMFHGDVSTETYASPVLGYLYCYADDDRIEECTKTSVITGPCYPDMYLKVSCRENDDYDIDYGGGGRRRHFGVSPSYFLFLVVIIMSVGILFRVYAGKARARQRQQNAAGGTSVQVLSTVSLRSDPSRFTTANYPRQQTQPFNFQGYQPSGIPEASSIPPYPAASYQPPPASNPPPGDDSELPSYDDAVKSQTHTT